MNSREFHSVTIRNRKFSAVMSADGPYIFDGVQGVAIGTCTSIRKIDKNSDDYSENGEWCIVKYRNQVRMRLSGFTDYNVRLLSEEFGIPQYLSDNYLQQTSTEFFFKSNAWIALKDWSKKHKIIAKRYSDCQGYLPWYNNLID